MKTEILITICPEEGTSKIEVVSDSLEERMQTMDKLNECVVTLSMFESALKDAFGVTRVKL